MNHMQAASGESSGRLPLVDDTNVVPARGTILLVEDEAFVREITGEILEAAGYRVLKTMNASEATRAFHRYRPIVRLLLTDVVLPGRNGRELANELRNVSPKLRIIFISGYPENAVTKNRLPENGMFYLPKPFSSQSLTRAVRQVMQQTD